ncbi:FMRF-Like Peptide [Caenorhabditis elegans]|uniref:FMRF-Like Peptide n=1 Tax=Caenorhabditis elegans TaxID=6239 RepID=Q95X32_CAEEL|nr:FMRF-Like Peptide [Caenorhabditis elegans]CCD62625.1 FMRF-Like Peptide [Caenorhabditis elegans]|eukprot:NP_503365.1 FMRF-Like Peptide [Caenorhabditis elegans]
MQFQFLMALIFVALVLTDSVLSLPLEKKADISTFASAINNAGRLRYGKRSDPAMWEENNVIIPSSEDQYLYSEGRYPYALIKRALNRDSLVASLNNAERLRFGRK